MEIVENLSERSEVSPLKVPPEPGEREPIAERAVLDRIFFLRGRDAEVSAARIVG